MTTTFKDPRRPLTPKEVDQIDSENGLIIGGRYGGWWKGTINGEECIVRYTHLHGTVLVCMKGRSPRSLFAHFVQISTERYDEESWKD